jgi:predicted XRE-type DNA-binding protein
MTKAQTFANVWEAVEDSLKAAATTTMRSNVMKHHQRKGTWLEHDAGASLDALLILATRAGLKVKIDVRSAV